MLMLPVPSPGLGIESFRTLIDAGKLCVVAHLCKPAPEAEAEHHQGFEGGLGYRVRACFKPRAGGW